MRKVIFTLIIMLLFASTLPFLYSFQPVEASGGTIYIRADGSVDPSSAPILNSGNIYYTLTANVSDRIVIERNNIVVDGAGYAVEGAGTGAGISFSGVSNIAIKSITIRAFDVSINMTNSFGNTITSTNLINDRAGIKLTSVSSSSISANTIANSIAGIALSSSPSNGLSANNITNCTYSGIVLDYSNGNSIYANNITSSYYGIHPRFSLSNSVFTNIIASCVDGIYLYSCAATTICTNSITNSINFGIWLDFSTGSIYTNVITNCSSGGIYLYSSNGNILTGNSLSGNSHGIALRSASSNSISVNIITSCYYGISVTTGSNGNSISANTITGNHDGIFIFDYSNGNSVSTNFVANNTNSGIWLEDSSSNAMCANTIANNAYSGIRLSDSSSNLVLHNNFVGNAYAAVPPGYANVWDNGYPSGGNYWSDYGGADANHDGIGDTPYVIDANNIDHYPLISPWNPTLSVESVTAWYWTSNTTINSVAVGDVNGDAQKETVTGGAFYDGTRNVAQLVVWNSSSLAVEKLTAWYWTGNTTITSVAIGDVDGDGQAEIVTGGNYYDGTRQVAQLVVWNGSSLAVKQIKTWYWTGNTLINSIALGDVDGDGQMEIVTGGCYDDGARTMAQLVVWAGSSLSVDRLTTWHWTGKTVINSVGVGDVDADGQTEIVTGGTFNDGIRDIAQLIIWTGSVLTVDRLTAWYVTGNTVIRSIAISDVDSDGQVEIVSAGYFNDGTRDLAQLIVWAGSSLTVERHTAWYWIGKTVINSVAIGDIDGDGLTEIITGGSYFNGARNVAQLVVWSGYSLAVETIRTWYWVGDDVINSVCLSDINGDFTAEIITGGAYYDTVRGNAQLVIWGMMQTV